MASTSARPQCQCTAGTVPGTCDCNAEGLEVQQRQALICRSGTRTTTSLATCLTGHLVGLALSLHARLAKGRLACSVQLGHPAYTRLPLNSSENLFTSAKAQQQESSLKTGVMMMMVMIDAFGVSACNTQVVLLHFQCPQSEVQNNK
eukprot:1025418-Amphidinium_carterae.1